jgi:hypothetical protein
MVVKEKFTLLKNVPNTLHLSAATIKAHSVSAGPRKVFVVLEMLKDRINHYTKDRVFSLISDVKKRDKTLAVVKMSNYILPVSYNIPTKQIILNITPFDTDDIYPTKPDPINIYSSIVYGICFSDLVNNKVKIPDSYFAPISSYLLSMFIRVFGKEYGLLGMYATEINKLKFLICCYIMTSFFGMEGKEVYTKATTASAFDYRDIKDKLDTYNFTNIEDLIKALSDLKVMPGLNRFHFTERLYRFLGVGFLPAIEDLSRFVSILTVSAITGSNVVPTFIYTYNEGEFNKIIDISKGIFK